MIEELLSTPDDNRRLVNPTCSNQESFMEDDGMSKDSASSHSLMSLTQSEQQAVASALTARIREVEEIQERRSQQRRLSKLHDDNVTHGKTSSVKSSNVPTVMADESASSWYEDLFRSELEREMEKYHTAMTLSDDWIE
jgi:hypothetical protein